MMMRFLGHGIGHKDQIKCAGHFNEEENQVGLEEDDLDLQNMARIAQDASNLLKKAKIARDTSVQDLQHADNSQEVMDSTGDDDDNVYPDDDDPGDDLDAVSNAEADEEYDLDGNL